MINKQIKNIQKIVKAIERENVGDNFWTKVSISVHQIEGTKIAHEILKNITRITKGPYLEGDRILQRESREKFICKYLEFGEKEKFEIQLFVEI